MAGRAWVRDGLWAGEQPRWGAAGAEFVSGRGAGGALAGSAGSAEPTSSDGILLWRLTFVKERILNNGNALCLRAAG